VVEWLTRSPAILSKADAFGRAGSNPVLDVFFAVLFGQTPFLLGLHADRLPAGFRRADKM
jgi:hypothetical protein